MEGRRPEVARYLAAIFRTVLAYRNVSVVSSYAPNDTEYYL